MVTGKEYHDSTEEILYRSNIYSWIVKIPGESERMKVVVTAKDEDEARRKATTRMDDMKDNVFMGSKLSKWRSTFDEQIAGSPVMIVRGDYDVFITFFEPD